MKGSKDRAPVLGASVPLRVTIVRGTQLTFHSTQMINGFGGADVAGRAFVLRPEEATRKMVSSFTHPKL